MSSVAGDHTITDADRTAERRLTIAGDWTGRNAPRLEAEIARMSEGFAGGQPVVIEAVGLTRLDTIGALALVKLRSAGGARVRLEGFTPEQEKLISEISYRPAGHLGGKREFGAFDLLADIGAGVVLAWRDVVGGVGFLGQVIVAMGRMLTGKGRFRAAALVTQLERVGLRGVPIIVLISFLVGAIIAQQSIFQLRSFGTVQFVADLLGILILRELAVLLTSIMIAGRSGSSFTAELGSMKMREEVDALRTMGLDPVEVLIVPRVLALIIALPLLTFVSAISALLGGGIVAFHYGGVSPEVFLARLQGAIGLNTFLVGLIKAPFMALVIGLIASIEGMAVRGSAESLGQHTTASVVKAIFMVIVVDGLFAMFFAAIRY